MAACRDLIVTAGVDKCSVENICAGAGFSRGAFYSNFSTKEELFAALAEEEYTRLVDHLRGLCEGWQASRGLGPAEGGDSEAIVRSLLHEAIDSFGFDDSLYLLHTELMTRAVRDPEWAVALGGVNSRFIDEMGTLLTTILALAGRQLSGNLRPLTHAAIALVLRAAAIHSWRAGAAAHADPTSTHSGGVATSLGTDIIDVLVHLLMCSSTPLSALGTKGVSPAQTR